MAADQQKRIVLITLASLALAIGLAKAQDATSGSGTGGRMSRFFTFEPMVDTGVSELGGRRVSVHVPGIFDLKLDTRPNHQGARLSQTVLSGLVRINLDRTRNADGTTTGPIDVRVMGIPVYKNEAARGGASSSTSTFSSSLPSMPSMSEFSSELPSSI